MAEHRDGAGACRKTAGYPAGARFKWNIEVLWAVDSYLRQASPEKQQQFVDAVRSGQIGLDALYGNELTGLCRPEELLRLLQWGITIGRRCGVKVESAMISDVPGLTWGTVTAWPRPASGISPWASTSSTAAARSPPGKTSRSTGSAPTAARRCSAGSPTRATRWDTRATS